jgi:hypothetical protein
VQRHVLYLGEINCSQAAVWRKAIEVLDFSGQSGEGVGDKPLKC